MARQQQRRDRSSLPTDSGSETHRRQPERADGEAAGVSDDDEQCPTHPPPTNFSPWLLPGFSLPNALLLSVMLLPLLKCSPSTVAAAVLPAAGEHGPLFIGCQSSAAYFLEFGGCVFAGVEEMLVAVVWTDAWGCWSVGHGGKTDWAGCCCRTCWSCGQRLVDGRGDGAAVDRLSTAGSATGSVMESCWPLDRGRWRRSAAVGRSAMKAGAGWGRWVTGRRWMMEWVGATGAGASVGAGSGGGRWVLSDGFLVGGARPEKRMGADGRRDAAGSAAGEDDVGVLAPEIGRRSDLKKRDRHQRVVPVILGGLDLPCMSSPKPTAGSHGCRPLMKAMEHRVWCSGGAP
ncbi:hypothetical protein ACLOJK_038763 [Asimina triloba]